MFIQWRDMSTQDHLIGLIIVDCLISAHLTCFKAFRLVGIWNGEKGLEKKNLQFWTDLTWDRNPKFVYEHAGKINQGSVMDFTNPSTVLRIVAIKIPKCHSLQIIKETLKVTMKAILVKMKIIINISHILKKILINPY